MRIPATPTSWQESTSSSPILLYYTLDQYELDSVDLHLLLPSPVSYTSICCIGRSFGEDVFDEAEAGADFLGVGEGLEVFLSVEGDTDGADVFSL